MNAIQSLGKSVIVQPKEKASSSTEFSSLLNTLEKKTGGKEAEPSAELKEEMAAEKDAGKQNIGELPFHFLVMNAVASPLEEGQGKQATNRAQNKEHQEGVILTGFTKQELMKLERGGVQLPLEKIASASQSSMHLSGQANQEKAELQLEEVSLPGFTKQELMKLERGGVQLPLEKIASASHSSMHLSGQAIQEKAEIQLEEVSSPGFTKQEWLKMEQGEKQALVAEVEKLVDGDGMKLVEGAKIQAPEELLAMIKQITGEPSSQSKNLVREVDQTTQLEEQATTVQEEMERPVEVKVVEEASSQVEKTEVSEPLENVERPLAETVQGDERQTDENPDGVLPLVKQNHDGSLKEVHVQARYLSTELSEMITERMQLSKNGDESNIRIKLSPGNLGQLDIRLATLDGKVTAHIVTATAGAKELIESQLHQLRHTLIQQGIQLDKVEVVQQPQGSQQPFMQDGRGEQGQQFQQGKQRQGKKGEYELEENPLVTGEREESTSGGINYAI